MARKTNCTVHGKDMYRLRAQIGRDLNGTPINKNFYGDSKRDAEKKRDKYIAEHENTQADINETLGRLAEYYTYQVLRVDNLAPSTIELYEQQYREKLKDAEMTIKPIKNITVAMLQKFFNDLSIGKRDGKDLNVSKSSIKALSKYMKKLFSYLYAAGYCQNLMLYVVIPKLEAADPSSEIESNIEVFSDNEVKAILEAPNRKHFLFLMALSTGLRIGELLALEYDDLRDDCVVVSKQLNSHYKILEDGSRELETTIKKVKSSSSNRSVPLPASVLRELEEYRNWHQTEMMQNGYRTTYLFTSDTGKIIYASNVRRAWMRHLKSCGIEYRKFHSCRATYCTMLCRQGIPLETAYKLMGHSDINVTAQFYRYVGTSEMKEAAQSIDEKFII
ncbi:tyrosine-type recombinase/integrase [Aminicella lysinilytica]|uniref:Site-specific recombinase XerD n=1 Tax=Aminicella lysinilytica TaxID=433323 RepID=A0A4V3CSA6_9FIRM|nr:site-specific integrase [Aminicella lysinilytica]TDP59812.1 site-specific recombinase XerD [Aminicella lysinilytica]